MSTTHAMNGQKWAHQADNLKKAASAKQLQALAEHLGVPVRTLKRMGAGWYRQRHAWTFPEKDGEGKVIGISVRDAETGQKRSIRGSQRGLIVASGWSKCKGPAFVVEGPSDTAVMLSHGLAAVGRPSCTGGIDHLAALLANTQRVIIVVGENDRKPDGRCPGKDGATKLAQGLATRLGREVQWAMPPEGMKDVRAVLVKYPDGPKLRRYLERHAETVEPAEDEPERVPVFSNFTWDENDKKRGLMMPTLRQGLLDITDGWPKRVGGRRLFVPGPDHQPRYLTNPQDLFAWIGTKAAVEWNSQLTGCHTKPEFFADLQASVENYETIERFPHFPPLPGAYYMHPPLPESGGGRLDQLVQFFRPGTRHDRELIKASFATVGWGGPPGKRPVFVIIGPDGDPQGGRNVGKSVKARMSARLAGGAIECGPREDMAGIKTRLLSPAGRRMRVAILDNVKTQRFSWAELDPKQANTREQRSGCSAASSVRTLSGRRRGARGKVWDCRVLHVGLVVCTQCG